MNKSTVFSKKIYLETCIRHTNTLHYSKIYFLQFRKNLCGSAFGNHCSRLVIWLGTISQALCYLIHILSFEESYHSNAAVLAQMVDPSPPVALYCDILCLLTCRPTLLLTSVYFEGMKGVEGNHGGRSVQPVLFFTSLRMDGQGEREWSSYN